MKKVFTLTTLLILFISAASSGWAQVHSTQTGTNTLNAATIMEKADAGTLYVAIQNHTTSANQYINKNGTMTSTFASDGSTSWQVVPHDDGGYALMNSDGNYIGNTSRPMTVTSDIASATRFEPEDANANVVNINPDYNSSQAVRWKVLPEKSIWINTNGANASTTVQFNSGTGNWTCLFTYEVTLKYKLTFNCYDEDDNLLQSVDATEAYADGETVDVTTLVPEITGYAVQSIETSSVTFDGANIAVKVVYQTASTNSVTYCVKDSEGKVLFTSDPVVVNTGTVITTLPDDYQRPFFYTYDTADITVTEDQTIDFTATLSEDAPFTPSASADNAAWYHLTIRPDNSASTGYPTYLEGQTPNVALPTTNALDETTQWAFVGNPYNGFQIVNKAAGSELVLGSAVASTTNNGGNDYATLAEPGTQECEVWTITKSTFATGGFFINNASGQYLNRRDAANLAYWTNGHDLGSTFVATKPMTFADKIVADAGPYMTTHIDEYFGLSSEGVASLQDDYNRYSVSCTQTEYEYFMLALEDALYDYMVVPETGYYRIKNVRTGETGYTYGYLGLHSDGKMYGDIDATTAASDPSTVIYLTNNGDGTFYLEMQGANIDAASQSQQVGLVPDRCLTTISGVVPGAAQILTGNGQYGYLHAAAGNFYKIVGWRVYSDSRASGWIFEDAEELTIPLTAMGDSSYTTLYLPFPVTLDATKVADKALNFYTLTTTEDKLVAKRAEENVIPAATAVLLISKEAAANATATIGGTNSTAYDNDLQGTYLPTTAQAGTYVFGTLESKVGFYPTSEGTQLSSNSAFFTSDGDEEGWPITFDESITGIGNIPSLQPTTSAIYDLQGRRVSQTTKGIYILNGKKVVLK